MIFFSWKDYYQGTLNKKLDFSRAWDALPIYVCWKIRNARNKKIFEGKAPCYKKVSVSAKNLWVDSLVTRGMKNLQNEPLKVDERACLADILQNFSLKSNAILKSGLPCWQNRMSTENLSKWRNNSRISSLFFDGASNGNPGIVGASGVILDHNGNKQA